MRAARKLHGGRIYQFCRFRDDTGETGFIVTSDAIDDALGKVADATGRKVYIEKVWPAPTEIRKLLTALALQDQLFESDGFVRMTRLLVRVMESTWQAARENAGN